MDVVAAGRRERERQQRREVILAAARKLFAERAYAAVRMADIAAAADLAKGTLYLYFADKDAIVVSLGRALLGRVVEGMAAVTGAVEAGHLTAAQGLEQVVAAWNDGYWSEPGLFRILVLDRPHLLSEFTVGEGGHGPRVLAPVEALVAAGQANGEWTGACAPEVVSHALWALFVGGLLLAGRGEISQSDLRASSLEVMRALWRGLCLPAEETRGVESAATPGACFGVAAVECGEGL